MPTFRVDVAREVDLIEEVGRHYGFDRLPSDVPGADGAAGAAGRRGSPRPARAQVLTAAGFSEAMTFAFIERHAARRSAQRASSRRRSRIRCRRSSRCCARRCCRGCVDACAHNRRRERQGRAACSKPAADSRGEGEGRAVAFVWSGAANRPHWSAPARTVDFFDAKGVVEAICGGARRRRRRSRRRRTDTSSPAAPPKSHVQPTARHALARHRRQAAAGGRRSARISRRPKTIYVARARSRRAGDRRRRRPIARGIAAALSRRSCATSRCSSTIALPAATVRGTIRSVGPATLVSIVEFDRYQGKGVPEGRVSLSLRLTFRAPDRTLTDEEVQAATGKIIADAAFRARRGTA